MALGRLRRKEKETRTCPTCGTEFQAKKSSKKKFCRGGCATKAQKREGRVTSSCEWCGTEFSAPKSRKKRFCSRTCGNRSIAAKKRSALIEKDCEVCGTTFSGKPHVMKTRRFCSLDCANTALGARANLLLKNILSAQNVLQQKIRPCTECGVDVSVPRNASDVGVRCPDHRVVLVNDEERKCKECWTPFIAKKGRLKSQSFCSKTCACTHVSRQNSYLFKDSHCASCEVEVRVLRTTADSKTFCPTCREANRKANRKRQYQNDKQRRIERTLQPIMQPASLPYGGYTLLHLQFDVEDQHWAVVMNHPGIEGDRKVRLAQYICEAQRGRFLREDEYVVWLDGDEKNDSPSNLDVNVRIEKIESRFGRYARHAS